jgi:hypothetical protein
LLLLTLAFSSSSFFFFGVSATTASEQDNNSNFLPYENATLGISVQYPPDWIKEEQDKVGVIFISPPSTNNSEASSVAVRVQIANLSLPSSPPSPFLTDQLLQNYTNSTIRELTAGNFSIIESNSTTIGIGDNNYTSAHELVFSKQEEEGLTIQQMQIYGIRDNKLYLITYIADAANYPIYLPTVQKMIDSFKIMAHQGNEEMLIGK